MRGVVLEVARSRPRAWRPAGAVRKAQAKPLAARVAQLEREIQHLQRELQKAQIIIEVPKRGPKKVAALLGKDEPNGNE